MSGNGRSHVCTAADVPFEEVRALCWELRRCRYLAFGLRAAQAVRNVKGEVFLTGPTEAKIRIAIDLGRMVEKLATEISQARLRRFEEWIDGTPASSFGSTERIQLKADVRRVEELVHAGGYRNFMHGRHDPSGPSGERE